MAIEPIRLKADDSAPLALVVDAQSLGIEHMDALRALVEDAYELRRLCTRGDFERARGRSVEVYDAAARALDAGESLMRACRADGVFSADLGVS
jgi:hypothetical protein